jgi:hypothetical protein
MISMPKPGVSGVSGVLVPPLAKRDSKFFLMGVGAGGGEKTPKTPETPRRPKVRILSRRGAPHCDKHQWQQPWPAAVVRQCAHCHAWMVPPL